MANEFKVKNGLIVVGDVTTSGTITINGALAATQSWVTSQSYLTSASLSGYATQSYVTSAIASLVDSAPAALDTLRELATALGNDASFSTTITNSIASKLSLSGGTLTGLLTAPKLSLTTTGNDYYLSLNGLTMTSITTGETIWRNLSSFRFSDVNDWDYNSWAGLKFINSTKQIVLGVAGNVFTANSPQTGTLLLDRIATVYVNNTSQTVWHSGNLTNLNQLSNGPGYLTSYTETDTLSSVVSRGATTSNSITVGGITVSASNIAGITLYDTLQSYGWTIRTNGANLYFVDNGGNNLAALTSGGVFTLGNGYAKTINFYPNHGTTKSRISGGYGNGYLDFGGVGYGNITKLSDNEIQVGSDAYPQLFSMGPGGTSLNIGSYTYSLKSGSTTYLFASTSGLIGIGTTSPTAKLHIYTGNGGGVPLIIDGSNSSDGTIAKFGRGIGGTEKNFYISSTNNQYINLGTEGDFKFKVGVTADQPYATGVSAMVITSAGNVGIGTTSPSAKLHLVSDNASLFPFYSVSGNGYTFQQDQYGVQLSGVYAGYYLNGTGGLGARAVLGSGGPQGFLQLKENGTTYTYLDGFSPGNAGYSYFLSQLGVGTATTLGAKMNIKGSGSTSATTSLLVQNSSGTQLIKVTDDGNFYSNSVSATSTLSLANNNVAVYFQGNSKTPVIFDLAAASHTSLIVGNGITMNQGLTVNADTVSQKTMSTTALVAGVDALTTGWSSVAIRPGRSLGNANDAAGLDLVIQGGQGTGTGIGGDILFQTKSANGSGTQELSVLSTFMTIKQNTGNVGIGTTSPSTKLDVSGVITATGGNSTNWNTAYGWGNHASQSYATTSYVTTQINNLINGAPGALDTLSELASALGNDSSFATTVTNSIAGKVSKSGDTITGNLGVVGNISSTTTLGIILNAADSPLITRGWDQFTSGSYNGIGRWGVFMEPSTLVLGTPNIAGNGQVAFRRFNANGTSTTTILINAAGDTTIYANLTVGGTITESSSFKLKENIETSEGNLEKVVNLRPVTYNKIGSQTTELGLIAEEVAEVYPEFVQYDENGEPVGVHYSRLTAALIGAVKELTQRIEILEKNG